MADTPEQTDLDARLLPEWATTMRVTKEQLEAAERTRAYHLRQLQRQILRAERSNDNTAHSDH